MPHEYPEAVAFAFRDFFDNLPRDVYGEMECMFVTFITDKNRTKSQKGLRETFYREIQRDCFTREDTHAFLDELKNDPTPFRNLTGEGIHIYLTGNREMTIDPSFSKICLYRFMRLPFDIGLMDANVRAGLTITMKFSG